MYTVTLIIILNGYIVFAPTRSAFNVGQFNTINVITLWYNIIVNDVNWVGIMTFACIWIC